MRSRLRAVAQSTADAPGNAPRAAAVLLPLALYTRALAPMVTLEDSGEFITVAQTLLGVAHPPGYPLWSLLALAWGLL